MKSFSNLNLSGFLMGAGVTAVGFYVYKKNQDRIENFLRDQGINVPMNSCRDFGQMELEELVSTKETIEDIIAEREMALANAPAKKKRITAK